VEGQGLQLHLKKKSQANGLPSSRRTATARRIFGAGTAGETVSMSSLHNQFYKSLPAIKNRILDSLVSQAFTGAVRTVSAALISRGFNRRLSRIWEAPPSVAASHARLPFIIAGVLSALIICGFGWFMPARTTSGTRTLEGVLASKIFSPM